MSIGRRTSKNPVERVRYEFGVTRKELAVELDVDYNKIYHAERGAAKLHPVLAEGIAKLRGTAPREEIRDYQAWIKERR